jgi:hypothetical protein
MTKMMELVIKLSFPFEPNSYADDMTEEEALKVEIEACKEDPESFFELMDTVTGRIYEDEAI